MHIIKITGAQGAGKSEALGHLAELHQSTVITGALLMAALAKMYPATYRVYLAGRDI